MARWVIFLVLVAALFSACKSWEAYALPFGERTKKMGSPEDGVIRVFFDQEGFPYPDLFIRDRSLKRAGTTVTGWLAEKPGEAARLRTEYRLPEQLSPPQQQAALRDSIVARKLREIQAGLAGRERLFVLVHGFRKPAYGRKRTSTRDFSQLKERIRQGVTEPVFLEVYWDGKFITPLQSFKYRGFKLFEQHAIPAARAGGDGLQRILAGIEVDTLYVIGHSLGALLTLEALTNEEGEKLPTPGQPRVDIVLVGPAIGAEAFEGYYQRNTEHRFREADNYRLTILYNEKDFVLNKTFQWAFFKIDLPPTDYGDTSLGCNYGGELDSLTALFRQRFTGSPPPKRVEIRQDEQGDRITCHRIECYLRGLPKGVALPGEK